MTGNQIGKLILKKKESLSVLIHQLLFLDERLICPSPYFPNNECIGAYCKDGISTLPEVDSEDEEDKVAAEIPKLKLHIISSLEDPVDIYWENNLLVTMGAHGEEFLDTSEEHLFTAKIGDKEIGRYITNKEVEQKFIISVGVDEL